MKSDIDPIVIVGAARIRDEWFLCAKWRNRMARVGAEELGVHFPMSVRR